MKTMIDVFIIEDNLSHLKEIEENIVEFSKKSQLLDLAVVKVSNYIEFYKDLDKKTFNSESIFIIDIHLNSYFTGMDIGKKLRDTNDQIDIIFLTSDPSFGIEAINSQIKPFSYILKTTEVDIFFKEDLQNALKKLELEKVNHLETNKTLVIKSGLENILLSTPDILYISTIKDWRGKVLIKTSSSELIGNGKLSDYKSKLSSSSLFLFSKSFIINSAEIQALNRIEGIVTFKNGEELFVGTSIVEKLKKAM